MRQLETRVWPHIAEGLIKSVVDVVFPLSKAEAAHRLMEGAGHNGKIVLQP